MNENELEKNETAAPVELTIVDLKNIRTVFDIAAKRGAFSAQEMSAVGAIYNRLDGFLKSVEEPQNPDVNVSVPPANHPA